MKNNWSHTKVGVLSLSLFALTLIPILLGCKGGDWSNRDKYDHIHCIGLIDVSGSSPKLVTNHGERMCNHVCNGLGGLDTSHPGKRKMDFECFRMGHNPIPDSYEPSNLPEGKPRVDRNIPQRDTQISEFREAVCQICNQAWSDSTKDATTNVFLNSSYCLSRLKQSTANHKYFIVQSDFMEDSRLFDFLNANLGNQGVLEKIKQRISNDPNLPSDLTGIQIEMYVQSKPELADLSWIAANIFIDLWKERGATVNYQRLKE